MSPWLEVGGGPRVARPIGAVRRARNAPSGARWVQAPLSGGEVLI